MPKLEIANNNRYGHRKIEEVPRWDRWDTRMPDVKDQLRAIWKSHTNLTHPGKYFRPSKVKIMRPTSPK